MLDLSGLNHAQLEAVVTTEGPVLVLAGAGSGKTRVITYRLAHLVEQGVDPGDILCATFTNKAAREMKERARRLVGSRVRGATLSTFHALGVRILRRFGQHVGLRPTFTITDAKDQHGTVRRILRSLRIDDRRFDVRRILEAISRAKNAGIGPDEFRRLEGELPLEPGAEDPLLDDEYRLAAIETYERYEELLRAQNVADFDDLLLLTVRLLQTNSEVATSLSERWRYVMVDEYQDTNGAQLELVRRLVDGHGNLCVVGDDDQSIYGWRGADVRNILQFEEHFPAARRVTLDVNYRSTGSILDAANAIIAHNPLRHEKRLRSAFGAGREVDVVAYDDEEKEAEAVAARILAIQTDGGSLAEIAILYRSNRQSRALALALRYARIPYRVVGGLDLFDRKELKDALAYLRVLWNPEDEQSLRRILNWPTRGIGATTLERIDDRARSLDVSLYEGLLQVDSAGVSERAKAAVADFTATLELHRRLLLKRKASTVARKLFDAFGIEAALLESSDDATVTSRRVDTVRDLVRQLERHEGRANEDEEELPELLRESEVAGGAAALRAFLSDLMLTGFDDDRAPQPETRDEVTLSTVHAAKGLEWKSVFVVGWEEELLPHRRSLEGEGSVEEERRLAYVAITRAQRELQMSYARSRAKHGRIVARRPSRFLDELPEEGVRRLDLREPSAEEREAVAKKWREKIKNQLGIEP